MVGLYGRYFYIVVPQPGGVPLVPPGLQAASCRASKGCEHVAPCRALEHWRQSGQDAWAPEDEEGMEGASDGGGRATSRDSGVEEEVGKRPREGEGPVPRRESSSEESGSAAESEGEEMQRERAP